MTTVVDASAALAFVRDESRADRKLVRSLLHSDEVDVVPVVADAAWASDDGVRQVR